LNDMGNLDRPRGSGPASAQTGQIDKQVGPASSAAIQGTGTQQQQAPAEQQAPVAAPVAPPINTPEQQALLKQVLEAFAALGVTAENYSTILTGDLANIQTPFTKGQDIPINSLNNILGWIQSRGKNRITFRVQQQLKQQGQQPQAQGQQTQGNGGIGGGVPGEGDRHLYTEYEFVEQLDPKTGKPLPKEQWSKARQWKSPYETAQEQYNNAMQAYKANPSRRNKTIAVRAEQAMRKAKASYDESNEVQRLYNEMRKAGTGTLQKLPGETPQQQRARTLLDKDEWQRRAAAAQAQADKWGEANKLRTQQLYDAVGSMSTKNGRARWLGDYINSSYYHDPDTNLEWLYDPSTGWRQRTENDTTEQVKALQAGRQYLEQNYKFNARSAVEGEQIRGPDGKPRTVYWLYDDFGNRIGGPYNSIQERNRAKFEGKMK
jgi:hypothetical protein